MSTNYKSTEDLIEQLIQKGIQISGEKQKQELINMGYYHGYKGYRFYKKANQPLAFNNFSEICATVDYDTQLKSLIYSKIMFIETALKNVVLNAIMKEINSDSIEDMLNTVISSYKNSELNDNEDSKKSKQKNKFRLESKIQKSIAFAYSKNNPKITHYYNKKMSTSVPLWALFEILTMGDFGELLQSCTLDMRDKLSKAIGINVAADTNRQLIYKYVYELKDLRNAIAHNDVIYDVRFVKSEPCKPMQRCLEQEVGLSTIKFDNLGDFIVLICYLLNLLNVTKIEISSFIREFIRINQDYENAVNDMVKSKIIDKELYERMKILNEFV